MQISCFLSGKGDKWRKVAWKQLKIYSIYVPRLSNDSTKSKKQTMSCSDRNTGWQFAKCELFLRTCEPEDKLLQKLRIKFLTHFSPMFLTKDFSRFQRVQK